MSPWIEALIDRRLNRPYLQTICILVLATYLIVLSVSFVTSTRGRTIFGPFLGADFGAFYIAGKIFNTHSPYQIYDVGLHHQLYQQVFPDVEPDDQLSYANAPFFVLPFALLSRLSYAWAYLGWLLISVCLYSAGLAIVWRNLKAIPQDTWPTAMLLALSFMPFLVECLAGGQSSAFGFFWLALAISSEHRNQFLSGAALSLCSYKPTLLLLIVPMLLVTRRYIGFLGFAVGNVVLAFLSLLLVGWRGCINYINRLLFYTSASAGTEAGLRSWKYVDINAFFRLLLGSHSHIRWIMTGAVLLIVLPMLFRLWWQAGKESNRRAWVWALTLAWTPVLNIYTGIYDSSILVLAALLLTDGFFQRSEDNRPALASEYKLILLLLYITPWITQLFARLTGFQIYTVIIAVFGFYQLLPFRQTNMFRHRFTA